MYLFSLLIIAEDGLDTYRNVQIKMVYKYFIDFSFGMDTCKYS